VFLLEGEGLIPLQHMLVLNILVVHIGQFSRTGKIVLASLHLCFRAIVTACLLIKALRF
jgi:hypothetical protein